MTTPVRIPITRELVEEAAWHRDVVADVLADRFRHPRSDLPADHPARLPASRLARYRTLATMRLRHHEQRAAERVHRWLTDRYELWHDD